MKTKGSSPAFQLPVAAGEAISTNLSITTPTCRVDAGSFSGYATSPSMCTPMGCDCWTPKLPRFVLDGSIMIKDTMLVRKDVNYVIFVLSLEMFSYGICWKIVCFPWL